MAGVYQPFETVRAAVTVLHREKINPVVAPVAPSRKLGHGHEFQGCEAQLFQLIQVGNNRVKGPFRGKSPHVQFINNVIVQG